MEGRAAQLYFGFFLIWEKEQKKKTEKETGQ